MTRLLAIAGVLAAGALALWAWADLRKKVSALSVGANTTRAVADAPPASAPVQPAAAPLLRPLGPAPASAPTIDLVRGALGLSADALGLDSQPVLDPPTLSTSFKAIP